MKSFNEYVNTISEATVSGTKAEALRAAKNYHRYIKEEDITHLGKKCTSKDINKYWYCLIFLKGSKEPLLTNREHGVRRSIKDPEVIVHVPYRGDTRNDKRIINDEFLKNNPHDIYGLTLDRANKAKEIASDMGKMEFTFYDLCRSLKCKRSNFEVDSTSVEATTRASQVLEVEISFKDGEWVFSTDRPLHSIPLDDFREANKLMSDALFIYERLRMFMEEYLKLQNEFNKVQHGK